MTEEKITKKPGPAKRFFRWVFAVVKLLFIVLLALLLITCLYCQAPPKILALVAIILATLTIIPKRARKWIWLTFAIIITVLVIWIFFPEEDGDWRPYTFDEELAALEAKRAIPDDQNAATIYNKLIETYEPNDFKHDFIDDDLWELSRQEPWSSQDYPELAKWIQSHEKTIALLTEASQIDKCVFHLEAYQRFDSPTWRRYDIMKAWARLLTRAASNDLGDGRVVQAIEKQSLIMQMTDHINQQPTLYDMLVSIALEALATHNIIQTIISENTNEENLAKIERLLKDVDREWSPDFERTLGYEKLSDKSLFGLLYEVNSKGRTRRSWIDIFTASVSKYSDVMLNRHRNITKVGKKVIRLLNWFFIPSNPKKMADMVEEIYREEIYPMAKPQYDWQKSAERFSYGPFRLNFYYFARISNSNIGTHKIHDLYLRITSDNKAARIIIALRRYKNEHGLWPDNLEDVKALAPPELFVDPINNDSFIYRLTEDGFTLYSKGKNNIDENGDRRTKKPDGTYTDDFLIWPPKSRKAKQ